MVVTLSRTRTLVAKLVQPAELENTSPLHALGQAALKTPFAQNVLYVDPANTKKSPVPPMPTLSVATASPTAPLAAAMAFPTALRVTRAIG